MREQLRGVVVAVAIGAMGVGCAVHAGKDAGTATQAPQSTAAMVQAAPSNPVIPAAEAPFYAQETHAGRIYIIGKASTMKDFLQTHHLPYTRAKVGQGPNRETLVFEIDPKDDALVERLEAEYARRNPR